MDKAALLRDVNLKQLRAFVAIGRLGSFTRAAGALHTTQPALSARIRELEAALAIRLFDRSTRSVRLTQAGEDLLPVVERALDDLGSVLDRAKDVAARGAGRVAVASLPSIASRVLPVAVARVRARYPGLAVTLRDALADRVLELVRAGEVDFGVTGAVGGDPALAFAPLFSDRIVAVLPARHPLARARRVALEALIEHPLILMDRDSSVRQVVDGTCAALGRLPAPVFEATFMSTAVGLVRAGLGITLLPSSAHEVAAAKDLAVRAIDHPGLVRRIGVLSLKARSLSPAAQVLVDELARDVAVARRRRGA
jgi:DNA-binding transcriptional LysR family regulator